MRIYQNRTLGSALLIGGTAVGAGMLALPLTTGLGGFFFSSILFFISFAFMLTSLFYLLEVLLMTESSKANLVSVCKEHLGIVGECVAWVSFLLLLYSVAAAYLSGGGSLIANIVNALLHSSISSHSGIFIFLLIFGFLVVFETRAVDIINRACMLGLIFSFIFLLIFVTPHIEIDRYKGGDPRYLWNAVPVVVLSFTSHIIIPSLKKYLHEDIGAIKKAFVWGSFIPLVFYLVWEFLIVGILPLSGPYGLGSIGRASYPISELTNALRTILRTPWVTGAIGCFSFFALVTSFFGVALSLYDFLADGLHIKKTFKGRIVLLFLMFSPPTLFAIFSPKGFIAALGYAGVFVAILYIILPTLIVWRGRYIKKKKGPFCVIGGRGLLLVMFAGSLAIIFLQIAMTHGWLFA